MNDIIHDHRGKLPRHVLRCKSVSATTWSKTKTVDSELREIFQVELVRNYRDGNGNWCKTGRFWPEDLPALIAVAQRTYEAILVSERRPAEPEEVGQVGGGDESLADNSKRPAGRNERS